MAQDNQDCVKKLKAICEKINFDSLENQHDLFGRLYCLLTDWRGQLPNLHEIFTKKEIEYLLSSFVKNAMQGEKHVIAFVANSGYKDEPDVDEDGEPLLHRTTPIHHAARTNSRFINPNLFKIYNRFDVNYIDETGFSHFHAACWFGCDDVVEKFLELGQDPNFLVEETGDSPLLLAIDDAKKMVIELLLRGGANPNLTNKNGFAPLHTICKSGYDDDLVKFFFEVNDNIQNTVLVDARDNLGRTPLQWAVANLMPDAVDVLLDRGADLSNFVFPTESYFAGRVKPHSGHLSIINTKLNLTSGALAAVERLENRGYELDQSGALIIMKFLNNLRLFEVSAHFEKCLLNDEDFENKAKAAMISPILSVYDFIRLRPEKAAKRLTYTDCCEFARGSPHYNLIRMFYSNCMAKMCKIMLRRFLQPWSLEFFIELTCHQLPVLCCEKIIEMLVDQDLYHIVLAVEQSS